MKKAKHWKFDWPSEVDGFWNWVYWEWSTGRRILGIQYDSKNVI